MNASVVILTQQHCTTGASVTNGGQDISMGSSVSLREA